MVFYCRFHSNLYKDCCAKKEFDALSGENILSHDLIDLIENKQEICENFKQICGMGYNDESSMMEDITVPSYVSNVIKYLSRKYRGEELFYNLLKIGV